MQTKDKSIKKRICAQCGRGQQSEIPLYILRGKQWGDALTPSSVGICPSLEALSPPCAASAQSTEDMGKIAIKMLNLGR